MSPRILAAINCRSLAALRKPAATGILRVAHRVDFVGGGPDFTEEEGSARIRRDLWVSGFELACGTKHVQAASDITVHVVRSCLGAWELLRS
jgi:hypothetical protein